MFSYHDTQIDQHDIENSMIINAEFPKASMPECINDNRLYVMRFTNIVLADQFDLFKEHMRLLNARPEFVEDFGRIHFQCFLSLWKRQPFSKNSTLNTLLRRMYIPVFDSPHFGLLAAFLLGSTSFLSFITSNAASVSSCLEQSVEDEHSFDNKDIFPIVDMWNNNSTLRFLCVIQFFIFFLGALAFCCGSNIEVQIAKDSIVGHFCNNFENGQSNHRIINVSNIPIAHSCMFFSCWPGFGPESRGSKGVVQKCAHNDS
jgi:hypothetical protein